MALCVRAGVEGMPLHLVNVGFGALLTALFAGLVARRTNGRVGLLATAACCAVPSSYLVPVRYGGTLWTIASRFSVVAERSLLLVPMAGVGAAALDVYFRLWTGSTDTRDRGLGRTRSSRSQGWCWLRRRTRSASSGTCTR